MRLASLFARYSVLDEMLTRQLAPSPELEHCLLELYHDADDAEDLVRVIEEMIKAGHTPSRLVSRMTSLYHRTQTHIHTRVTGFYCLGWEGGVMPPWRIWEYAPLGNFEVALMMSAGN